MPDILIAIDLNHDASWQHALPEAVAQARSKGATLHLAAIVPDFGMTMIQDYFPAGFEKEALTRAYAAVSEFATTHVPDDVKWKAHVGHGDIDREILRLTEEIGASLIVMASHPPSELRSFLVGSHADRIVHRAPVSVLVVRG